MKERKVKRPCIGYSSNGSTERERVGAGARERKEEQWLLEKKDAR